MSLEAAPSVMPDWPGPYCKPQGAAAPLPQKPLTLPASGRLQWFKPQITQFHILCTPSCRAREAAASVCSLASGQCLCCSTHWTQPTSGTQLQDAKHDCTAPS